MTLLIVDVAFQSIRLMIVGAESITVDAWTRACAVDQFYKRQVRKSPSQLRLGLLFFPILPGGSGISYFLTTPSIFDKVRISKPGLKSNRLQELARYLALVN